MRQRTTLTAEGDHLEPLRAEAKRRGVSLNAVLEELVERGTSGILAEKRPRLGLGDSGGANRSHCSVTDEESPAQTPYRS